jgi:dTMP kinase
MKFLVVEGVDGSGKSTQIKLIRNYLETNQVLYRYMHFPRTDEGIYGELIARFLRGDLGGIDSVNPYLVALIYAGDRKDAAGMIANWIKEGYLVLLDRYVYSNIAFQCAKISTIEKRNELRNWIMHLEYEYFRIPKPDLNILLDVPFSFTKKNLTKDRAGSDRDYLQGTRDIHEEDLDFQRRVRDMYIWQSETSDDLKIIGCNTNDGNMRDANEISRDIIEAAGFNSPK